MFSKSDLDLEVFGQEISGTGAVRHDAADCGCSNWRVPGE
jgi:hypothetical protein